MKATKEFVERVAKALCRSDNNEGLCEPWNDLREGYVRGEFRRLARAAIAAIPGPTSGLDRGPMTEVNAARRAGKRGRL